MRSLRLLPLPAASYCNSISPRAARSVRFGSFPSRLSDGEFRRPFAAEVTKWSFPEILTENLQVTCPLLFVHEGMDITTVVHWERALTESSEKPSLARAPGNVAPSQPVKTAKAAAPGIAAPAAQRAAAKTDVKIGRAS